MQDSGCKIQDARFRMQGFKDKDAGFRTKGIYGRIPLL